MRNDLIRRIRRKIADAFPGMSIYNFDGEPMADNCPACGSELIDITSPGDPMKRVLCPDCGHEELVPCEDHAPLCVTTAEDDAAGIDRYLCQYCGTEWTAEKEESAGVCPNGPV